MSRVGRAGLAVLGVGAVLTMTGCAAGQVAETAEEPPAVNGAVAQTGKITISDASLVYPDKTKGVYAKGSDIELALSISNSANTDDKLVDVASKAASDVTVKGDASVPSGGKLVVGDPGGSNAAGDSAADSDESQDGDDADDGDDEQLGHARVALRDTTRPVKPGYSLPVTFTFAEAGSVTTELPVANTDDAAER